MKNIIKRDGTVVDFDSNKILTVLKKVNNQVGEMSDDDIDRLFNIVQNKLSKITTDIKVEDIQDIVEDSLLKSKFNKSAKAYILYRDKRTRIRQSKSKLLKEVAEKIYATNVVNQNANIDEKSFGGRKGEADSILMKELALNYLISPKFAKNHNNNRIYIHDLDSYFVGMSNCLSLPIDDLLKKGMKTRQVYIRPANSLSTAMQLVAVAIQLQSLQQFGGVAVTHIDWSMIPYIRKSFFKHFEDGLKYVENKSDKEIKKINDKILEKEYKKLVEDNKRKDIEIEYLKKSYSLILKRSKRSKKK